MQIEEQTIEKTSWREKRKQELRGELISCAIALFEEKGLDAVSVDDIVGRCGIAKGTFYLYFKTKSELIESVLDDYLDKLEWHIKSALQEMSSDASVALKRAFCAHLEFFIA